MKPYYDHAGITIYHGDCREILPDLEPVDLVLTDPPYGIGDKWSKSEIVGSNGRSSLWGKGEKWDNSTVDFHLLWALLSLGKVAICWGGNYYNFPPSPCWFIWDKKQRFSAADAEMAWTNIKSVVRVFRMSRIDAYQNRAESKKRHPTQKPLDLMKWCIEKSKSTGTILDPFMGSGTTLRAAKDLGRKAIGIEIEEKYCEIAAKRLSQEVLDFGKAVGE